jgi:hypothetical protein
MTLKKALVKINLDIIKNKKEEKFNTILLTIFKKMKMTMKPK